jgi:hypothetical protein
VWIVSCDSATLGPVATDRIQSRSGSERRCTVCADGQPMDTGQVSTSHRARVFAPGFQSKTLRPLTQRLPLGSPRSALPVTRDRHADETSGYRQPKRSHWRSPPLRTGARVHASDARPPRDTRRRLDLAWCFDRPARQHADTSGDRAPFRLDDGDRSPRNPTRRRRVVPSVQEPLRRRRDPRLVPPPTGSSSHLFAAECQKRPGIPASRQNLKHDRMLVRIEDSEFGTSLHETGPSNMHPMPRTSSIRPDHAPTIAHRWKSGSRLGGPNVVRAHISEAQNGLDWITPALLIPADVDSEATLHRSSVCR